MAVDGFIPEIWSARLLEGLRKALVFAQPGVVNRDYEGEIRNVGDTVRIGSIGAITISNYAKNTDITGPEALTDAMTALVVDQGKYFNFQVDDVDQVQAKPNLMDGAMRDAAYRLRDTADGFVAGLYADAGSSVGTSGAPKTDLGTATNAYLHLVALGVELDQKNVPSEGRFVVVPPWYHALLLQDDRFVKSGTEGGEQRLVNGQVGTAAGFTILKSNNVSNDATTWRIPAGNAMAWSFADQISKVEAYRPEKRFADAVKGLHIYGAKVIRPDALSILYANRP